MVFWPETTCFGLEYLFWLPKHSEMLTANIYPGTWAVTVPLMTGEIMFTCKPLKSPGLLVCCLAPPVYKVPSKQDLDLQNENALKRFANYNQLNTPRLTIIYDGRNKWEKQTSLMQAEISSSQENDLQIEFMK